MTGLGNDRPGGRYVVASSRKAAGREGSHERIRKENVPDMFYGDYTEPGLYSLTSLQIGDIQSYVSRLFLLVACRGLKLVFLVDNGPWTGKDRRSRPQELWQLLVHKSRRSPFANRLHDHTENGETHPRRFLRPRNSNSRIAAGPNTEGGWLSLLIALQGSWMDQGDARKRSHGLYGCVAFEVAWSDVRGINYSNELQTDTCVSLEAKIIKKREFRSLEQARACYDTILSGPCDKGSHLTTSGPCDKSSHLTTSNVTCDDCPRKVNSNKIKIMQVEKSQSADVGPTNVDEISRTYITSLNPSLGISVENARCLHKYFTPPSSPYHREVISNFSGSDPRPPMDSRKCRIVPVHDIPKQKPGTSLPDMMTSNRSGSAASAVVEEDNFVCQDGSCSSGSAVSSDHSEAAPIGRVWLSAENGDDCGSCSTSTEALFEPICVHPDRLIAPAEIYRDILILFRFSEPLLPVELRKLITSDRRLLKMLESGLPPWVIFLQSYPILCHIYRPWMRPLCGTVYYLISIITVLIGFYDLYKNVPVLKATAAHICGPLFEWIEGWEMVSRLKYLGTMLFLQNCEKAFEWALVATRAGRQISVLLMRPVLTPLWSLGEALLPLWIAATDGAGMLVEMIGSTMYSAFLGVITAINILIWPFFIFLSTLFNLAWALFYPIFVAIWTILAVPIHFVRLLGSLFGSLSSDALDGLQIVWNGLYDTTQYAIAFGSPAIQSLKAAKSSTPSPSMWKTLWKDILSKVFHAVNGIIKGLAAFITACNRHRLSLYNQAVELSFGATGMLKSAQGFLRPLSATVVPGSVDSDEEKSDQGSEDSPIKLRLLDDFMNGDLVETEALKNWATRAYRWAHSNLRKTEGSIARYRLVTAIHAVLREHESADAREQYRELH